MQYCEKEGVNPFLKDYYIKQFNDVWKYGEHKYDNDFDNFTYIRVEPDENQVASIIEDTLYFLMRYNTFQERTGLGFTELMSMDPSTARLVQKTWEELSRPEEKQQASLDQLQKQIEAMTKMLGGRK